jgi:hypothetical protein
MSYEKQGVLLFFSLVLMVETKAILGVYIANLMCNEVVYHAKVYEISYC